MFKNDLIIQGGPFTNPTMLSGILSKRMNIVFGRNGSGKSTIARAFREQQASLPQRPAERKFQLSFDQSGSFSQEVQGHLFVFNEDFILDSVRFPGGGLKSIIRIGASAQLDAPIQDAKDKIKELEKDLKRFQDQIDTLEGDSPKSIAATEKALKDGLKSGYIDRLDRIEARRHNLTGTTLTAVTDKTIPTDTAFSTKDATKRINEDIDRYLSFQDGSRILWQAPDLSGMPNMDEINGLLVQSVRPAELSDLERMILDDLSSALASQDVVSKTQEWIVNDARSYCPLCHQPVSEEHKHTLEQRLLRFRDRQVEDFKKKVAAARQLIVIPDSWLPDIPVNECQTDIQDAQNAIAELNEFLASICVALDNKHSNPFAPQAAIDKTRLSALVSSCQKAMNKVSADVAAYNKSLDEKQQLLQKLKQDNVTLAVYENRHLLLELKAKKVSKKDAEDERDRIQGEINAQKDVINSLMGQMDQVDVARDQINNYLDLIFGEKKLRLANAGKDSYELQLRSGNAYVTIPTKWISSGERNALALAYFFACVLEKKEKDYKFDEPTLLVIDDPVSSFDAENKAGVISLLSIMCEKVLKGCDKSKVLIFTHDATTLRELCSKRSFLFKNNYFETAKFYRLRQNRKLREVDTGVILENMEYFNELNTIFGFANCSDPEEFDEYDAMGNTIRGFAESYATRMFRCKWNDLFTDDDRLNCIPPANRDKIKSFAIRPVLNSESHGVIDEFEPSDVQRAARVLLAYMYYASREHLQAYLVGQNLDNVWKMNKIKTWAGGF